MQTITTEAQTAGFLAKTKRDQTLLWSYALHKCFGVVFLSPSSGRAEGDMVGCPTDTKENASYNIPSARQT